MAENLNIGEMVLGENNQNDDTKIERCCCIMAHAAPVSRSRETKNRKDQSCDWSFLLRVPGLEPGAFWFVAKRSIQLGYIRVLLSSFVDASKYRIIENNVKGELLKKLNFFSELLFCCK